MRIISTFILLFLCFACSNYKTDNLYGDWYYKTTLFQFYPNGSLKVKNLDEDFFDLNERHGYPLNYTGKWCLINDRINLRSVYGLELAFPLSIEETNQLWFYIGDPDDMNVIRISKLNKPLKNGCKDTIISQNIKSIANSAFVNNKCLRSITIPQSTNSICNGAFWMCDNLEKVMLHEGVQEIGDGAFADCTKLKEIKIPSSVNAIGKFVFSGCTSLRKIVVDNKNTKYDSRNECNAIIHSENNKLISGCNNTKIPNTIKSIGEYAFRDCSGLYEITIPSSVDSISCYAFSGCVNLKKVFFSDSIRHIAPFAFHDCKNLNQISLPKGLVSASNGMFFGCSNLRRVSFPESVIYIGINAFAGCNNLKKIIIPKGMRDRFEKILPNKYHQYIIEN